ncbi:MAG: non-ribosomal peptide synthetase [Brasilonema octagenarum HA4186-MV1]|jgi:amino acid adenylation domain-containing protein|nr:non-ribosomal peptide synthetase [Brasilonema octagenarum HA4186-MV1]
MNNSLQQLIQRYHVSPTNSFIKFNKADVEQSIGDRFQKQVRMYPERIAIKTREYHFTYETLNRFANRIARAILTQCGHDAEPIALLFESGAPIIAAMLGVLKTGKFYVPLDTSLPQARNSYILEDLQANLLITDSKHISQALELNHGGLEILNIDELDASLSTENLDLPIQPDSFAYIIYTSGSTGHPKGVIQNHRYVLHLTMNYTNSAHICADDRLALLQSPTFTGAVRDIYCALLNGGTVLPFDVKREGLINLSSFLQQEEITVFFAVATLFRHFANTLTGQEKFPKLRLIQLGSETIYKKDAELYQQHFSDECILVANLGSTEISPIRQYFIDKKTEITSSTVPVGYAVEDTEVLLIDEQGKPVGFNQIGEIVVKSRYLSVGYWQKPEITQAVFLADPDGGDERLYKTGDLGCMMPDGCLLHLGRKDFQVKVRGYRIEVAEVEMALFNTNLVREVAVLALPDHVGEERLVAYIVPQRASFSIRELRRLLRESLPSYMVPSLYITLETLPLTPTGKIDRRALPAPDQVQTERLENFVAPRTLIEHQLAEIWSQVLRQAPIGIHDNFFELGGDSLLATQVIARIPDVFSVNLSLQTLFTLPTIASLAERIETLRWTTTAPSVSVENSTDEYEEGAL